MADTNTQQEPRAPDDSDTNTARQGNCVEFTQIEIIRDRRYHGIREPAPILHDWEWEIIRHYPNEEIPERFLASIVGRTEDEYRSLIRAEMSTPFAITGETYQLYLEEALTNSFLVRLEEISKLVKRQINRLEKLFTKTLSKIAFGGKVYISDSYYCYRGSYHYDELLTCRAESIKGFIEWYNFFLSVTEAQSEYKKHRLQRIEKALKQSFNEKFGERLKKARAQKNYSAKFFSKLLNISPSAYSNYECGLREPPLYLINKMSVLLGVSLDWLLGRSDYSRAF